VNVRPQLRAPLGEVPCGLEHSLRSDRSLVDDVNGRHHPIVVGKPVGSSLEPAPGTDVLNPAASGGRAAGREPFARDLTRRSVSTVISCRPTGTSDAKTRHRMQNPPPGYPRVSPYLLYEDARAAVDFLTTTFGFRLRRSATGAAGRLHAELVLADDGLVMLGQAGAGFASPRSLGAHPASMVHVYVDDVDAVHGRALSAGADVGDLEVSPAGDRRFTAEDPEGQVWVFAQRTS
jgi:PhnB protein